MGAYGYGRDTMQRYYNSFAQKNQGGYISYDKYQTIATRTGMIGGSAKYQAPSQYDPETGNKLYSDEAYNKIKAEKEEVYFKDVQAAAEAEASKLGGGSVRKASGSYGDPESEAYSERIRGNIRKAIGRNQA